MDKDYDFKISAKARRGSHVGLTDLDMATLTARLAAVQAQKMQAIQDSYRVYGVGCTKVIAHDLVAFDAQINWLGAEIDRRNLTPRPTLHSDSEGEQDS